MTPVTFFRISLLLPIITPLALLPFGLNAVLAILAMSLAFGGVQYILFAGFLFYWVGRLKDSEHIRRLSYVAPLYFIPIQAAGWVISGYIQKLSNPNLVGIWEGIPVFAVYTLIVGYSYVGIVNLLYIAIFRGRHHATSP